MSNSEPLQVGVLPLARPTFDVPYAEHGLVDAWNLLEKIPLIGLELVNCCLMLNQLNLKLKLKKNLLTCC